MENKKPMKWFVYAVGTIVGVAHIGVLGHLIKPTESLVQQPPTFNLPKGPYSSYKIEAGKDGYRIEYRANDPAVLESERSSNLDKENTMEGTRNIGGAISTEGKSAKDVECLLADAGARSQGAMAGSAITTGVVAPAVMGIPYIGWLAAGWATLLGNQIGETIGSEVGSAFNDC